MDFSALLKVLAESLSIMFLNCFGQNTAVKSA